MVGYSNRISDLADKCELNEITQQEIMAMIFICGCRSTHFRQDLRRQGEVGNSSAKKSPGGTGHPAVKNKLVGTLPSFCNIV